LLASGEVDAVYIATPAALHRRWTLAALEAGLHVLCEKPFAANADDARVMADAASGSDRVVMEAFHWRYHPLVSQVESLVASIGTISRVDAVFNARIAPDDIRWDIELGGGSTMDLGCYCIQWVRWIAGSDPRVIAGRAEATEDGVDIWLEADFEWESGVVGSIRSSMVDDREATLVVTGSEGVLTVDNPTAPQGGSTITLERNGTLETHPVERSTTYFHQLAAFRDAVFHAKPFPTTAEDAVRNMEVVDACYRAAGLTPRPTTP
jgi:predicted dehydrogenase